MKIAIRRDHRGREFKKYVMDLVAEMGHTCQDYGTLPLSPWTIPIIAAVVGRRGRRQSRSGNPDLRHGHRHEHCGQ